MPLRTPYRTRTELDRQPVDQARQIAFSARLLDQAVLRGAQAFRPLGLQRERVEPEFRIERRSPIRNDSASSRCKCFGSRLAMAVATDATATLPSTR